MSHQLGSLILKMELNTQMKLENQILDLLNRKKNVLLMGAPGTGKSRLLNEVASLFEGSNNSNPTPHHNQNSAIPIPQAAGNSTITFLSGMQTRVFRTVLHQNSKYRDFFTGYVPRPGTENGFEISKGILYEANEFAKRTNCASLLIIDEINRANISKVFGELITLIEDDKRWGEINETCATLQSGDVFAVPNNLYIIGTMNSADKSISLIDAALRRRFIFKEQRPNADLITDPKLKAFFERLNAYLYDSLGSADLLVGHSYFMGKTAADLPNIMNDNIIPLLYEYFYDNKKNVNKAIEDTMGKVDYTVVDNKTGRIFVIEKE